MFPKVTIATVFAISLLLSFHCNTKKDNTVLIEGDLYYDWFRWGSFYNLPDSFVEQIKNALLLLRIIQLIVWN